VAIEVIKDREIDFDHYRDCAPTDLQARFAQWLIDKCELEFKSKAQEEGFRNGVRLAVYLRIPFQASDENKEAMAERKEQRAAERAEEEERPKPKAKAKKAKPADDADDADAPAPKKRGRKPKVEVKAETEVEAEEQPTTKKRRKRRAAAGDADF
jgi:hypothetical protein